MCKKTKEEVLNEEFSKITISDLTVLFENRNVLVNLNMSCQRLISDLSDNEMAQLLDIKLKKIKDISLIDLKKYKSLTNIGIGLTATTSNCDCVNCN